MEKKTSKPIQEEVVREFTPLGKYRIRLVRNPRRPEEEPMLDIREFISSDSFEGFTRRGIRLGGRAQMDVLRDVLRDVLELGGFVKSSPGTLPLQ